LTAPVPTARLEKQQNYSKKDESTVKLLLLLSLLAPAQQRATELQSLTLLPSEAGLVAVFEGDGWLEHRVVQEQNPEQRLIVDVLGVRNPLRHYYPPETHPFLERILMYEYPASTNPNQTGPLARIVFELKGDVDYHIEPRDSELWVTFTEPGAGPNSVTPPDSFDTDYGMSPQVDAEGTELLDAPSPGAVASGDPSGLADISGTENLVEPEPDPNVPEKVSIEPEDIPPSLFFEPPPLSGTDYRLGPEDVIDVRVFELDQLNRKVRVSGDGRIELPLVGSLQAAGLTEEEVASKVADRLKDRYVQNPQVSIFIAEFNSQKVSLLGAVQTPSTYPLAGQRRLLQVLAEAGSLAPEAGKTLYVFRQTGDGRSARLTVPLNDLLLHGDPRWNIALMPGDVVSVPPEDAIAVSVLGAVNSPGVHKLPVGDEATLLKAVALAGGLNERASKKGLQIKRRDNDGKEAIIKVNLGKILSGKEPDVVLVEGDVIIVNESFF
jgi:polysaccharide export outer membrane protein